MEFAPERQVGCSTLPTYPVSYVQVKAFSPGVGMIVRLLHVGREQSSRRSMRNRDYRQRDRDSNNAPWRGLRVVGTDPDTNETNTPDPNPNESAQSAGEIAGAITGATTGTTTGGTGGAVWAVVDSGVFAALRELTGLDGGSAVQTLYVCLARRLPNIRPSHERIASDSGFSVSTVKRAVKLLERSGLIRVHRVKGYCPRYELIDLGNDDRVRDCLSGIRRLAKSKTPSIANGEKGTKVTTDRTTRVSSDPTPLSTTGLGRQVKSDHDPGSGVSDKEPTQDSNQDPSWLVGQGLNVSIEGEGNTVVDSPSTGQGIQGALDALRRHGIHRGEYLLDPNHPRSLQVLTKHPQQAGMLIDQTLKRRAWKADEGVGLKIHYLRQHVDEVWQQLNNRRTEQSAHENRIRERAEELAEQLIHDHAATDRTDTIELSKANRQRLLKRGLATINESPQIIRLVLANSEACDTIIRREWNIDQAYFRLDEMTDEELLNLKAKVLAENPQRQNLLRDADPRTSAMLRSFMARLAGDRS